MAELLSTLSIISFALAGFCFVLSIFFWFFFKIPTVIGDLSGRTARKSIAKMRQINEQSGSKGYRESKTNLARGKVTGTVAPSEKLSQKKPNTNDDRPETGLLSENLAESNESEETGLLSTNVAENSDSEATGLLNSDEETVLLDEIRTPVARKAVKVELIEEIILIHTSEVIE